MKLRDDLVAAHHSLLARWSQPGSFWSGRQRLGLVEEVRRARDNEALPPWVEPSSIDALRRSGELLPDAAIDAIWRLTNHPGTLTVDWYHSVLARGLGAGAYVELVAVVAQANCLDRFCDGLGMGRYALPDALAGDPVPAVAADASVRSHWVPTAELPGPNVLKGLSMLPFENESRAIVMGAHYVSDVAVIGDLRSGRGGLSRPQMELIAARTSTLNECFY